MSERLSEARPSGWSRPGRDRASSPLAGVRDVRGGREGWYEGMRGMAERVVGTPTSATTGVEKV